MREQARDDQAEPDAAQAEHRVLLVHAAGPRPAAAVSRPGSSPVASATATLTASSSSVGQELVQRRVDQPDGDRQPVHRLEDADEVLALQRQQRVERGLPLVVGVGQDQPLDQLAPVAEEHVLGAAQPDALGAEAAGPRGVLGGVGVGPHAAAGAPRRRG